MQPTRLLGLGQDRTRHRLRSDVEPLCRFVAKLRRDPTDCPSRVYPIYRLKIPEELVYGIRRRPKFFLVVDDSIYPVALEMLTKRQAYGDVGFEPGREMLQIAARIGVNSKGLIIPQQLPYQAHHRDRHDCRRKRNNDRVPGGFRKQLSCLRSICRISHGFTIRRRKDKNGISSI